MHHRMYYSDSDTALETLERRHRAGIRQDVEAWWKKKGMPIPDLPDQPRLALFARQVAQARFEDYMFFRLAWNAGFTPVWLEYTRDCFSSRSEYKRSLLHPMFCTGRGKAGPIVARRRLVKDVTPCAGTPLCDISMDNGESLVGFHHDRWSRGFPGGTRKDFSDQVRHFGSPELYYHYFLSWFIAHGVLFEEFHAGESDLCDKPFIRDVFQPAWCHIREELGFAPLIVSVPWREGFQFHPEDPKKADAYGILPDAGELPSLVPYFQG